MYYYMCAYPRGQTLFALPYEQQTFKTQGCENHKCVCTEFTLEWPCSIFAAQKRPLKSTICTLSRPTCLSDPAFSIFFSISLCDNPFSFKIPLVAEKCTECAEWPQNGKAYCIRRNDEITKRNDETKRRNEMTKSLSDNHDGFGVVGLMQYFIFHSRLDIERPGYHINVPCCELFSRLKPHQYTRSENTYSIGNQASTPALKHVHVDY